jgi:hypothetical protein
MMSNAEIQSNLSTKLNAIIMEYNIILKGSLMRIELSVCMMRIFYTGDVMSRKF